MAEETKRQIEESETGSSPVDLPATKPGSGAFANVRRELTEEELSSPGARRLLLYDRDRLDGEVAALRRFQQDYYAVSAEAQVLKERLKIHLALDVCWGVGLSVGFGLLGVVSNIWDKQPFAKIVLGLACVLIVGAIAVRTIKR